MVPLLIFITLCAEFIAKVTHICCQRNIWLLKQINACARTESNSFLNYTNTKMHFTVNEHIDIVNVWLFTNKFRPILIFVFGNLTKIQRIRFYIQYDCQQTFRFSTTFPREKSIGLQKSIYYLFRKEYIDKNSSHNI